MSGWVFIRIIVGIVALVWGILCWSSYFAMFTPAYKRKLMDELKKESPDASDDEIVRFIRDFRFGLGVMGGASIAVFLLMCLIRT